VPGNENDQTQEEFDSLLDDLLSEEAPSSEPVDPDQGTEDNPLTELKATLLAVDWEINDDIMAAMLLHAEKLEETFQDNKVNQLFLQLLRAVGKYIKTQKANAHPDAIKLLSSIYTGLEIVSMAEGMTDAEKKKILKIEVARFKSLKQKVAEQKTEQTSQEPPVAMASVPDPKSTGDARMDEVVQRAVAILRTEITDLIRAEFETLRSQLKSSTS